MFHTVMLSNKKLGKEEGRGDIWNYGIFSFQVTVKHDESLLS